MTTEEKKARIREMLDAISEDKESAELWFKTPSLAFGNRSPQHYLDANDKAVIDLMLSLLEKGLEVLRDEIASGRIAPMSTAN